MIDAQNPAYAHCFDWHLRQQSVAPILFPELHRRVGEMLKREHQYADTREEDWLALLQEIEGKPAYDSDWPRQSEVAQRLGCNKMRVARMIKRADLRTNGKIGHELRVDPASILAFCEREGRTWNDL